MTRKITEESVNAFMEGRNFKKQNMEVEVWHCIGNKHYVIMYLHWNAIARREMGDTLVIEITDAGWATVTTKERLNWLPRVSISQKKWVWYLNGKELTNEYYERQGYWSRLKWLDTSIF